MLSWSVSWGPVIVAALVTIAVGAAWYSPAGFGKTWMKLAGVKKMGDGAVSYLWNAAAALVQAFLLANLVRDLGSTTVHDGLLLGFIVWLGFVAATTIGDVVFGNRPWKLWQINAGYWLVVLLINGWLLSVWK